MYYIYIHTHPWCCSIIHVHHHGISTPTAALFPAFLWRFVRTVSTARIFFSTRRAPGGVTWTKPHDGHRLVNIQKTLENRHLSKVNQLWMCHVYQFSIAMLNYQRVELLTVRHPNMFTPTSRSGRAVGNPSLATSADSLKTQSWNVNWM